MNHAIEYWSVLVDSVIGILQLPMQAIWHKAGRVVLRLPFSRLGLPLARLLASARLGVLNNEPDDKANLRTRAMWESATRRGIQISEFRMFGRTGSNFFIAVKDGKARVFDGLPRPNLVGSLGLEWMDNKAIMKKVFQKAGIPVARGGPAISWRRACDIFQTITPPIIVKPHIGSRSRHTHLHIQNESQLRAGYVSAKKLSPVVIVEEELIGTVFRPTLIGGRLVAVARKDPAYITGNGKDSVLELVEQENKNPKRSGPIFHRIKIDDSLRSELVSQGMSLDSVPPNGRYVALGQKTGRGDGGSIADVTSDTHPENVKLFEKLASVVDDPVIGVDFVIQDISRPWQEQPRCGVLECNSLPFIDVHHYPLVGESRDVAGELWDLVFPPISF